MSVAARLVCATGLRPRRATPWRRRIARRRGESTGALAVARDAVAPADREEKGPRARSLMKVDNARVLTVVAPTHELSRAAQIAPASQQGVGASLSPWQGGEASPTRVNG